MLIWSSLRSTPVTQGLPRRDSHLFMGFNPAPARSVSRRHVSPATPAACDGVKIPTAEVSARPRPMRQPASPHCLSMRLIWRHRLPYQGAHGHRLVDWSDARGHTMRPSAVGPSPGLGHTREDLGTISGTTHLVSSESRPSPAAAHSVMPYLPGGRTAPRNITTIGQHVLAPNMCSSTTAPGSLGAPASPGPYSSIHT